MIRSLLSRLRGLWLRRYFVWHKFVKPEIPLHPLSWLPEKFCIQPITGSDVSIIDGFCSDNEVELIIRQDPAILNALICRASMLAGIPVDQFSKPVLGASDEEKFIIKGPHAFNLCLLLETESEKVNLFDESVNLQIEPRVGRAVCWANDDISSDTSYVQLNDRPCKYIFFGSSLSNNGYHKSKHFELKQIAMGAPLSGDEYLPDGVWAPGKDHLENVFGKPDFLTDLIK
ncbi:MAG: hypothetical protein VYA80_02040 [Pseudomonadota bacterium]|nr:hypothetical protein [Pseudomonadota bacterium]